MGESLSIIRVFSPSLHFYFWRSISACFLLTTRAGLETARTALGDTIFFLLERKKVCATNLVNRNPDNTVPAWISVDSDSVLLRLRVVILSVWVCLVLLCFSIKFLNHIFSLWPQAKQTLSLLVDLKSGPSQCISQWWPYTHTVNSGGGERGFSSGAVFSVTLWVDTCQYCLKLFFFLNDTLSFSSPSPTDFPPVGSRLRTKTSVPGAARLVNSDSK